MSDLISRQAAIDALAKFVPYAICDESTESYTNGLTDAYNLICQLPSAQPAVNAVPVRHGKWINKWSGDGSVWLEQRCSECGCTFEDEPNEFNYCPNCGARMDADETD